jgi:hypothetical protein
MENIINKLRTINSNSDWSNWSLEEKKQLLELYLLISKKEHHIFKLIYDNHDCDSWEDIFRDFSMNYLDDKLRGVRVALENLK